MFLSKNEIHNFNTQCKFNLHLFSVNLTVVQRSVFYSGCKIFNNLPLQIRSHFEDLRFFKKKLKSFRIDQSLYSIVEYYQLTSE